MSDASFKTDDLLDLPSLASRGGRRLASTTESRPFHDYTWGHSPLPKRRPLRTRNNGF